MWVVPPPQVFDLSLPATIHDGTPGAGAGKLETKASRDEYRFTMAAGQSVTVDVQQCPNNSAYLSWKLINDSGATMGSGGCYSGQANNLPAGNYRLVVTPGLGTTGTYTIALAIPPAAPPGDNFADATAVAIPVGADTFTSPLIPNVAATMEPGEQQPTMWGSNRSCWLRYTPQTTGTASIDTELSEAISSKDTEMAVYVGTWGNLTKLRSDSDSGPGFSSRINNMSVTAGTTYYVQITAYNNASINYKLRVVGPATG